MKETKCRRNEKLCYAFAFKIDQTENDSLVSKILFRSFGDTNRSIIHVKAYGMTIPTEIANASQYIYIRSFADLTSI